MGRLLPNSAIAFVMFLEVTWDMSCFPPEQPRAQFKSWTPCSGCAVAGACPVSLSPLLGDSQLQNLLVFACRPGCPWGGVARADGQVDALCECRGLQGPAESHCRRRQALVQGEAAAPSALPFSRVVCVPAECVGAPVRVLSGGSVCLAWGYPEPHVASAGVSTPQSLSRSAGVGPAALGTRADAKAWRHWPHGARGAAGGRCHVDLLPLSVVLVSSFRLPSRFKLRPPGRPGGQARGRGRGLSAPPLRVPGLIPFSRSEL